MNNLGFLNSNAFRAYPLRELSRVSVDGLFNIPDDLIVGFSLAATSDVTERCYISRIISSTTSVTIEVSDSSSILVGNFVIPISGFQSYSTYFLTPSNFYTGANGKLTVGSLINLTAQPTGNFTFTLASAEIEPTVIIPFATGIDRLIFTNADGSQVSLTGSVEITARQNLAFKKDFSNNVFLDAGDNLGLNSICSPTDAPIFTINGVGPDGSGNFEFYGSGCLTLNPVTNGLVFTDICSSPCIGCDSIATLTSRVTTVESNLLDIKNQHLTLASAYENFKTTVNFACP